MKKNLITTTLSLVLAIGLACSASAQSVSKEAAQKAFDIMDQTDDILAYHGDYSATISLEIEKPGKPKENLKYKIFERVDSKLMTIVQLFPESEKGTGYLRDGDNIWAYDPISRKFTHSSLKESLGDSDIKISDVNQTENSWHKHYEVTKFEEGKLGKYPVYIISLHAITTEPSYANTTYYIRKDLPLMLKQEDFSGNGRLMRTTLCLQYTKVPAGYVPSKVMLHDELNKGENTHEELTELTFDKLPDNIFTKAYLEGLN